MSFLIDASVSIDNLKKGGFVSAVNCKMEGKKGKKIFFSPLKRGSESIDRRSLLKASKDTQSLSNLLLKLL